MSFIRTATTRRLLAVLGAAALVVAAGTAIALAAGGGGPAPPAKPLARAVRDALAGPSVRGLTARVKFTNHLIDTAGLEGSAPLLKGGSGRLWLTEGHVRVELQSDQGDAQIVSNGRSFWVYDSSSNTVYRGSLPARRGSESAHHEEQNGTPSLRQVERAIGRLAQHAGVSGASPVNTAGRPAYEVRVAPHHGGLVGFGQLAFDASRGVPLSVGVYPRGGASPVLQLAATDVSYGPVSASSFAASPPRGARVVDVSTAGPKEAGAGKHRAGRDVSGRAAVAKALPFRLSAPSQLAGKRLAGVHLAGRKGGAAAVATYGSGLGGIAVIQRRAEPPERPTTRSGGHEGRSLSIPRVKLNGVSAEELVTPLGTLIRFERGGVSYVVLGSVSRTTAETAANSLLP
jgi:outer membrane lipoprotein-sorting protein